MNARARGGGRRIYSEEEEEKQHGARQKRAPFLKIKTEKPCLRSGKASQRPDQNRGKLRERTAGREKRRKILKREDEPNYSLSFTVLSFNL